MRDDEFRRRAHEILKARQYQEEGGCLGSLCPGEDAYVNGRSVPCSPDCEVAALLAAGPSEFPYVVKVGDSAHLVLGLVALWCCPSCGVGVNAAEDGTCATCGATVFRSDVPWLREWVRTGNAPARDVAEALVATGFGLKSRALRLGTPTLLVNIVATREEAAALDAAVARYRAEKGVPRA